MLEYPSILGWRKLPEIMGETCSAFEKYDGSNLRWEWTPKQGWFKYGTRHCLFNEGTELFSQAVDPFKREIGKAVVDRVCTMLKRKPERIVAFTEFFGPSSFAGTHVLNEDKELKLFDISVFKQGFLSPDDFQYYFGDEKWSARLIYRGPFTEALVEDIQAENSTILNEGVVCKGGSRHDLWRVKIKTRDYMERLHRNYPNLYNEEKDQQ